jgi:hypothetical protein
MSNDLAIINEALVRIGVNPLASLSDAGAQALTASTIYTNVKQELLSDHPWYFALREQRLAKLSLQQDELRFSGWRYVYQMPADRIRVLGLRSYDRYQLSGDQLYADDRDARLVYVSDAPEQTWPPYFRELVVFGAAAAFAISLTDNTQRADLMYAQEQRLRSRARAIDSQQTPPQVFNLMRIYVRRTTNPLSQA